MHGTTMPFEYKMHCMRVDDILQKIKNAVYDEVSFSDIHKSFCVGIVDIINSTGITASLQHSKMCEYYRIFLNTMSAISKEFGGIVVKNIGDSLLYYFPKTCDGERKDSLKDVLECSLAMIESHQTMNKIMSDDGLPQIDYRVSCDYGKITIAQSPDTFVDDIFGPTVNVCAKINIAAYPNSIVIGGDLQQLTKSFSDYTFKQIGGYSLGLKMTYPVYSLYRSKRWFE